MLLRFSKTILLILIGVLVGACSLLGGDDEKKLITNPGPAGPEGWYEIPRWSPDGQTILYYNWGYRENSSGELSHNPDSMGIWAVDTNGQNKRMLFPDAHYADWSPDGEWIVFVLGAQIYKLPYDGHLADTSAVVPLATEGRNFFPNWSSNGEWITYDRSIEDDFGPSGVWRMDPEGNNKEYVFGAAYPNWHPDGNQIIGTIGTSPTSIWKRFEIYTLSTGRSVILDAVVDQGNQYPKFSPDGSKILFQSDFQVWVMDSDGENLTQLTSEFGAMPDWSPDGEHIVYIGPEEGFIWIMDADGNNKRLLID